LEAEELIKRRRSIRRFKKDPVPKEKLESAFEIARWSPVAKAFREYEYYVLSGKKRNEAVEAISKNTVHLRDILDYLHGQDPEWAERATRFYSNLGDAPVIIVVVVPEGEDDWGKKWQHIPVSTEITLLLLGLEKEGLGACGIALAPWVEEKLKEVLELNDKKEVLCAIAAGFPDESPEPPSHPRALTHYLE
jgi:nitroreductase